MPGLNKTIRGCLPRSEEALCYQEVHTSVICRGHALHNRVFLRVLPAIVDFSGRRRQARISTAVMCRYRLRQMSSDAMLVVP